MSEQEMQERIEELETKNARLESAANERENEIAEFIVKQEELESTIEDLNSELKRARADEKKYWDGYKAHAAEFNFPDWEFLPYQKDLIRTAVEHIRYRDSLKGLGQ